MTVAAAAASGSGSAPGHGLNGRRRARAIFTVLAAMALAVLDAGMANVALPDIGRGLAVSPGESLLVVTAYQAGLIAALLPLGAIGERFGHRRVFTASIALFAVASAFSALSPSLIWLVPARFVQGVGGAGIMGLGVALLRFTVSSDRLGAAIGWNALVVALASAAGPSLGALILSMAGWPWLFAMTLPIAALALLGSRSLPVSPLRSTALDFTSMALNASVFGTLILAVQTMTSNPALAAGLILASVIALRRLLLREAPKLQPLFPLDLLRTMSVRLSVIASVCCFAAQSAGLLALPFLLHQELHLTPLTSGLYVTVWPLSVAVAAMIAGGLSDRIPTAWLCAAGGAILSAGLTGAGLLAQANQPLALLPFLALAGVGFGLFQSPNNRNLLLSAPAERSGAAGGLQGTARVTGQTAGVLIMTLLFSLTTMTQALQFGFGLAALLALAASVASLTRRVT